MKLKRMLISAYGCEPNKGSEQGVGWNWCLQLTSFAEIFVITRSNNQAGIENALPKEIANRISFIFYDLPDSIRRFKKKEKGLYWYYLLWQWGAYQTAKKLTQHNEFDYVMHLTFGSIWLPTFMHRLPVPFIWGPIGGGEAVPFRLIGTLPLLGRLIQYLRYLLIASISINPLIMGVVSKARIILARTEDTAKIIPHRYQSKVRVILETAMADDILPATNKRNLDIQRDCIQVIYTGRLIPLKNVATALHAIARAQSFGVNIHFQIYGDGPLRSSLESLANSLGIRNNVEFCGVVSQDRVIQALCNSDVYLFPSLKEGGVWSLMEAMSVGLPIICVNTSGMATITDDNSAIRIFPQTQEQMVEDFSQALLLLATSSELRNKMGNSARNRIQESFRWQAKGQFMNSLLKELDKDL